MEAIHHLPPDLFAEGISDPIIFHHYKAPAHQFRGKCILHRHAITNREVEINVIDIIRIKNGRYTEHWAQHNFPEVLRELGGK